jgi:RNA polymerase sigma factor (sigma-70 family)
MHEVIADRTATQAVPTDPVALWYASKRILFAVARKVRLAIRLELEGFGRDEAEAEELVNDAFIALCEAMPRFDPAKACLTTFVYALARRRMWLVARAAFFGLSPEAMHATDTSGRTPRYHLGLRGTEARRAEAERRLSILRVEALRQRLTPDDRRLVDVYLEEGGNRSAVARRLGLSIKSIHGRYLLLFRRIRRIANAL